MWATPNDKELEKMMLLKIETEVKEKKQQIMKVSEKIVSSMSSIVGSSNKEVTTTNTSTPPPPSLAMKKKLNFLIASMESHNYWERNEPTTPPRVTHMRKEDLENKLIDHRGGHWERRLTRHLYGKQCDDGRFIFGGDRRVHPTQDIDQAHILPRCHEDFLKEPHEQACEILPLLKDLPVALNWGGIMPFSIDGKPLIGKVPLMDESNSTHNHRFNKIKSASYDFNNIYVVSGYIYITAINISLALILCMVVIYIYVCMYICVCVCIYNRSRW